MNKNIFIIGGGIVGLAVARALSRKGYKKITIIEKEEDIALHQSSRNSGVMHAGLYYKPGSLKSKLSREGINLMKKYCTESKIEWEEIGKIVVATNHAEEKGLEELFTKGKKNELKNLEILNRNLVTKYEPYVSATKGILVPEESIVNYKKVARSYLSEIESIGGSILYKSKVKNVLESKNTKKIVLESGNVFEADVIISCSGAYSDKTAKLLGIEFDNQQIIPFRGEYYHLKKKYDYLVNGLIYPVPNPELPFLGVHFTKMIDGSVEAGPNAVLALAREGYSWQDINLGELMESIGYGGLQKFILKYPLTTIKEFARSISKRLFVKSLQRLIPEIKEDMLVKGEPGIRAQLMNNQGDLIQDFDIRIKENVVSILNAPSPAATSSLAIADYVVRYLDL